MSTLLRSENVEPKRYLSVDERLELLMKVEPFWVAFCSVDVVITGNSVNLLGWPDRAFIHPKTFHEVIETDAVSVQVAPMREIAADQDAR